MRWANENPEQWEAIARLPLREQNEALRDAIASNRQYAREFAAERIHHHRDLSKPHRGAKAGGVGPQPAPPASAPCPTCNDTRAILRDFDGIPDDDYCPDCMADPSTSDDVVCESDAQKPPAGDGRNFLPHRTPVGSRFRRLSLSCDNCSAPEGVDCQPWCRAEQIS